MIIVGSTIKLVLHRRVDIIISVCMSTHCAICIVNKI